MTRIPFDQLAKQYLETLLEPLGTVQRNLEVPGESKFVDLWFMPTAATALPLDYLGLLSRIASTPCLLEPFSYPPTRSDIRACLLKLFWILEDLRRKAKQQQKSLAEKDLPQLWLLAASVSQPVIAEFDAQLPLGGLAGVYVLPEANKTAIVAIDQLPQTEETLWVRILGRGRTQRQAIADVLALSSDDPRRGEVLQLLVNWKITVQITEPLEAEEQELMAELSQAYLEWEEKTKAEGIQQGLQEGLKTEALSLVVRQLNRRFNGIPENLKLQVESLSLAQLESLSDALLDFATLSDLESWLHTYSS